MPSGYGGIGSESAASIGGVSREGSGVVHRASTVKTKSDYAVPKKKKVPFTPPQDYNAYRNGVIGRTVTDPNTGRDYKGTWNPYDDGDPNGYGFWSFRQDPSKEPFYDPTLPPGYTGYKGQGGQSQGNQLGVEALLALLSPSSGRPPMIERRHPAVGGTRYVNSAPMRGYSSFLGG